MSTRPEPDSPPSADELEVAALYGQIIDGWNQHSAATFAGAFAPEGEAIGFDGSRMTGREEIAATLVASKRDGGWQTELLQTTPAQFHGRPEEVERMTEELQQARLDHEGEAPAPEE